MTDFTPYVPLSEHDLIEDKAVNSAPRHSPIFTEHRDVTAIDTGAITTRGWGMVMAGFEKAIIRVLPTATADITIDIMFWSDEAGVAGQFVAANPAIQRVGAGAGVPYDYVVDVYGKTIFVYITGTIGTGTKVQVAGFGVMPEP